MRRASCTLPVERRIQGLMESREAQIVAEDPPPTNNGVLEEPPARQDVDVLLDVSELEVDKIHLTVRNLRAHVSVLTGTLGNALGALENVLEDLEVGGTVDEALRGSLRRCGTPYGTSWTRPEGKPKEREAPGLARRAIFLRGRAVIGSPTGGDA